MSRIKVVTQESDALIMDLLHSMGADGLAVAEIAFALSMSVEVVVVRLKWLSGVGLVHRRRWYDPEASVAARWVDSTLTRAGLVRALLGRRANMARRRRFVGWARRWPVGEESGEVEGMMRRALGLPVPGGDVRPLRGIRAHGMRRVGGSYGEGEK